MVYSEYMDTKKKITIAIVLTVVVLGIVLCMNLIASGAKASNKYVAFSQCLEQKGAKFYGAFWCPHCQQQEKMLGLSRATLEKKVGLYVECSTADGKSQTEACKQKNIESYPTWEFADGTRMSGEIELSVLGAKTGCVLAEQK